MTQKARCPVCKEVVHIQSNNQKFFQHCGSRHPIDANLTEKREQKVIVQEPKVADAQASTATVASEDAVNPVAQSRKDVGAAKSPSTKARAQSPAPIHETLEVEEVEEVEEAPKDEEVNPDDYEYHCKNCGELFNGGGNSSQEDDGLHVTCPDCGQEYIV